MRLGRREAGHAWFRELLSRALDEPLRLDESWQLSVHLSHCEACRAAEREFREQGRALRTLGSLHPPRDLWARTSAALDHETIRHSRRGDLDSVRPFAAASMAGSLAVLAVIAVLSVSQLPFVGPPESARNRPTPFAVLGQALAYLGAGPQGLSIYRASINSVCPPSALDCQGQPEQRAVHSLSRPLEPRNITLSPNGQQLAISGRDEGHDNFFAIVLMPMPTDDGPLPPGPPPTRSPTETPSQRPSPATQAPTPSTPGPDLAVLDVHAILEDAIGVGAPPAWSGDGSALAFSAMPADGSHGPDLYLWRPGDELAERVTRDNSTYFASWSGDRIVVSRVSQPDSIEGRSSGPLGPAEPTPHAGVVTPGVATVVIDPETGDESLIEGMELWLPQVNRQRTHAVGWQGTLGWRGHTVTADEGALFVVEWAALDPFAFELAEDRPAPNETDEADTTDEGEQADEPPVVLLFPLEPARDAARRPVRDWELRWSPDGDLVGFWTGDVVGADWGRLAVVAVDDLAGEMHDSVTRLSPVLARRAFTLHADRVTWIGPASASPEGELRVTVWNDHGHGELRLSPPEDGWMVAPF